MSVSYIHYQFSGVFPGSATLQRGFWSRAGARRSQGRTLAQDIRHGHLAGASPFRLLRCDGGEQVCREDPAGEALRSLAHHCAEDTLPVLVNARDVVQIDDACTPLACAVGLPPM